ncbi:alpha/beta hydrolase family esterase [Falsiroseomonas sp. HW251]|uniref:alpha/beta hydrolase family esterase n=1 Tax=Falsiroseomonas sp. HW251 TaxID=3390998 RepID=UPI003D31613A
MGRALGALLLAGCGGDRLTLPDGRSAVLDRPADTPAPTLVVLHGAGLGGQEMRGMLHLPERARAAGFAVVYPDAGGPFWNDGTMALRMPGLLSAADDIGFLDALLDRLVAERIADPARIHLAGLSSGGMLALRYACLRAGRLASLLVIAATQAAEPCAPARPLPVLIAAGTDDPVVRWDGGVMFGPFGELERRMAVPEGFAYWRRANGCAGLAAPVALPRLGAAWEPDVLVQRATGCRAEVATLLYEIRGGGHRLPGRDDWPLLLLYGRATPDIEAGAMMLDFARDPRSAPGLGALRDARP